MPSLRSVTKWIKSCLFPCFGTFKLPFLMFISILVFRPEDKILTFFMKIILAIHYIGRAQEIFHVSRDS